VSTTAADYIRDLSASMSDKYTDDCLTLARHIVDLLRAEGREAWMGRLRDTVINGDTVFHGPLTPLRYLGRQGPTWTTHYVACAGRDVYDPLIGVPIDIDDYSQAVFGKQIAIERL
jgi:hypothetical protein